MTNFNIGEIISYDVPGVVSASLIPGDKRTEKVAMGNEIGDAILIDLERKVLALSDGPERNPDAASGFLKKFDKMIVGSRLFSPNGSPFEEDFETIVDMTNKLSLTLGYHDAATFSAIIIGGKTLTGLPQNAVMHTGDSMIFLIDSTKGEAVQISRTNHFLLGRAPRLFQTQMMTQETKDGDMVVITSDGITDLAWSFGLTPNALLSLYYDGPEPGKLVEGVRFAVSQIGIRIDDIGIIAGIPSAINTHLPTAGEERVIL